MQTQLTKEMSEGTYEEETTIIVPIANYNMPGNPNMSSSHPISPFRNNLRRLDMSTK